MIQIMSETGNATCKNCGRPIVRLVGDMEVGKGEWTHNPDSEEGYGVYQRWCKDAPLAEPDWEGEDG